MDVQITSLLLSHLTVARKLAQDGKSALPAKLTATDDSLQLWQVYSNHSNGIYVEYKLPNKPTKAGQVWVDGDRLFGVDTSVLDKEIRMYADATSLVVKGKRTKFSIPIYTEEQDFTVQWQEDKAVELPLKAIMSAFRNVRGYQSKDEIRLNMCAVELIVNDNSLIASATNGTSMARCEKPVTCEKKFKALIPSPVVDALYDLCGDFSRQVETVKVAITQREIQLFIETPEAKIKYFGSLSALSFPDLDSLVKYVRDAQDLPIAKISAKELQDGVKACGAFANKEKDAQDKDFVTLSFSKDKLVVSGENHKNEQAEAELDCTYTGSDISYRLPNAPILFFTNNCVDKKEEVMLEFLLSSNSPSILLRTEGSDEYFAIMTTRRK